MQVYAILVVSRHTPAIEQYDTEPHLEVYRYVAGGHH